LTTIIVNERPYENDRAWNGIRLAGNIAKETSEKVRLFFIGDGVWSALEDHDVPQGIAYNLENMLKEMLEAGSVEMMVCGTCLNMRQIARERVLPGINPAVLTDLSNWITTSDRVVSF
jgi:uncharacterized protein involved in oxidation of intracellular sulfur